MIQQKWDTKRYEHDAGFVAKLGLPVLDLLAPLPDERILDIGCGDGSLTLEIEKAGAHVIGIDSSENMIKRAKERGLNALLMSGENLTFEREFDAVFSNAALHWMTDYHAVIKGVTKALKPGGRFIAEFGGAGNVGTIHEALKKVFSENPAYGPFNDPWFFPEVTQYQSLLEQHRFKINTIQLIDRPTPMKAGIRAWLEIFAQGITKQLTEEQRNQVFALVENIVRPTLFDEQNGWHADYKRLRFSAQLA